MRGIHAAAGDYAVYRELRSKELRERTLGEHEIRLFPTTDGREIAIQPVSQYFIAAVQRSIEAKARAAGLPLDAPTYTITTAAGAIETHPHDETTLTTDEEKAAWAAYTQAVKAVASEQRDAQMKWMLLDGLKIGPPPDDWQKRMKRLGVALPDDADDLRFEYIQAEVLKTPADLINAMMAITRLSMAGAPAEAIADAEASFRRALARASGTRDTSGSG